MFGQDDTKQDENNTSVVEPTDAATDDTSTDTDTSIAADSGSTDEAENVAPVATTSDASDSEEADAAESETTGVSSTEPSVETAAAPADTSTDNDLLEVKKEALTDLAPLVSHLDQTPEEHFKTIMMLIQATDNSSYIKEAYESAKQISDDAMRAQALLDIVNEINYFTQKHNTPTAG